MTDSGAKRRPLRIAAWTGAGIAAALGAGALFSLATKRQAERGSPPEGRFLTVAGQRLHVVEAGEGPPVVLVHGLGGQLRNFSYALLGRLAKSHRVILVDRPGAGHSPAPSGPALDLGGHAAVVAALIETLGLPYPLVVGHSFGGAVALALTVTRPDLVGGLALIAPLSQPEMVVRQPFAAFLAVPDWMREIACRTTVVPVGRLIRPRVHEATFFPDPVPADFYTKGGGGLALRPATLAAGFAEIASAGAQLAALAPRYRDIAVPSAILFARHDRVLDPVVHGQRTAQAIPGCAFELVEGGHMLPVTDPDLTACFIEAVRARMTSPSPS